MTKKVSQKEAQLAARALEKFFAADGISKRHIYKENLIRGFFFSIGGVIGTTLGFALIAWTLSLFNEVPIIGPFIDKVETTINK